MKALRSSASAIARRISGLSNGGDVELTMMLVLTLVGATTQTAFGACVLTSLSSGIDHLGRKRHVELAGDEGENGGRAVRDDGELDAVEMRQALLPVIRVAGELDQFVGLELDELERAGADRMGAHFRRRNVAGIDRRIAGGEQRQQRRLRPLQVERDLEVAVGRDVVDLVVPGLARVLAEFLRRLAHQHVEGAFDVGGGERLAVMPLDALAQLEGQRLVVAAPGPAFGEIRHDRCPCCSAPRPACR